MKFGPVPVADAAGAILAHSLQTNDGRMRKGRWLSASDVQALSAAGHGSVIVARLDPDEIGENQAAGALAAALADNGEPGLQADQPFTGRVNLRASGPGVLRVDTNAVARINDIDPAITLATLPQWQRVGAGTMAATVKIIPYGVRQGSVTAAVQAAKGALALVPPRLETADLIVTQIGGTGAEDKGVEAIRSRLKSLRVDLKSVSVVPHEAAATATALAHANSDLVLILTASATSDQGDIGPLALANAGGRLTRFGMPVDPGNLLFLGDLSGKPVIGLPGCARSPALNGADWVMERVICGIPITSKDIAEMGVGGLLKEIPTRPQPRERKD